jgi:4-hydroxy-tetrahydrodipicolinate reductase
MTETSPLRVCVAGASGRMGRMLIEAILASTDCKLAGALDVRAAPPSGRTLAPRWAAPVAS